MRDNNPVYSEDKCESCGLYMYKGECDDCIFRKNLCVVCVEKVCDECRVFEILNYKY